MASASSLPSEEYFLCSICLDLFADPVVTPCGHNYCKTCITHYWNTNDACLCPLCTRHFYTRPDVYANTFLSDMVQQFRSHKWKEEYEAKTEAEVRQMIQDRQVKIQEVRHSVELSRKDADREIADSVQVCTALISSIQRSQAELIDVIEEKQKTTEKQAEGIVQELQQEITQLEKRCSGLSQRSHEDHIVQNFPSNSPPPSKDWTDISVHPASHVGSARTALAQLEKTLGKEMKRHLLEAELRRVQQYAVDVTLDPDTAHRELALTEDGKQVNHGVINNILPDNAERFYQCICVLGKQGFSSGMFYYEVQVKGKTNWDLGVARESINRKGPPISLNPKDGYWTIVLRNGNEFYAAAGPGVRLPLREELQRVGVFVDYEAGLVSFYDVEARVPLYSFTGCSFAEKLYPYFSPCNKRNSNSAPLIISPVNVGADLAVEVQSTSPPTLKRRKILNENMLNN